MPTVPFNLGENADEKRETTGELTILSIESVATTLSAKPEAIVRPLRRREPSDDENRAPDLQDLEAQIIDKLIKLETPQKTPKESEKKFRESKKGSRDVSDVVKLTALSCHEFEIVWENGKINTRKNYFHFPFFCLQMCKAIKYFTKLIQRKCLRMICYCLTSKFLG